MQIDQRNSASFGDHQVEDEYQFEDNEHSLSNEGNEDQFNINDKDENNIEAEYG